MTINFFITISPLYQSYQSILHPLCSLYACKKTPYSGTFVKSPRQKCKRLHRKVKSRKTCSETKNAHSYPNTAGSLYAKRIFAAGGKYANRFCAGSTPSYAQRLSHIYFGMIYRIRLYCKHSRFFGGLVYFSAHYPLPTPARRRIVNAAAIQKKQSEGRLLIRTS